MLEEFTRAEMANGEAFVRCSALVSLAARWRVCASEWKEIEERAEAMKVEYPEALAKRLTYEACAEQLEKELRRAGSEANS